MIGSAIQSKIQSVFQKVGPQPDNKLTGEKSWSSYDANRDRDRFESHSDDPAARDGSFDVGTTHHPMAPPYRIKMQLAGDLNNGTLLREQALFVDLPVRTEGNPTFLTSSETTFSSEGVTKLEVVEGPDKTTARRLFHDYDEPHKDYVEEYFLAR